MAEVNNESDDMPNPNGPENAHDQSNILNNHQAQNLQPKAVTAAEALVLISRQAGNIQFAADQLAEQVKANPPVKVGIGGFYRTFNGSLVYVCRRATRCQCMICTGRATLMGTLMGNHLLAAEEGDKQHNTETDVKPEFIAVVMTGGHTHPNFRGDRPGSQYVIDETGRTTGVVPSDEKLASVGEFMVGMFAMCLRYRVQARWVLPAGHNEAET